MLAEYLQTLEYGVHTRAYLFLEDGTEALRRATLPGAKTLAGLATRTGQVERELAGSERFWALPGAGPSGHMYVLVLAAERPLGGVMALRYEPVVGPIPLLAVLIMAGVLCFWLARQSTAAEVPGYLDRIEREAERLNRLIGQMLTLARLESGVDLAQQGVFDLGRLVQEVVADGDFEARSPFGRPDDFP